MRTAVMAALAVFASGACGGSDSGDGRYVVDDVHVRRHIISEVRFDAHWAGEGSPPEFRRCTITVLDDSGEPVGDATTTISGEVVDDVYTTVDVTGTPDTATIDCGASE